MAGSDKIRLTPMFYSFLAALQQAQVRKQFCFIFPYTTPAILKFCDCLKKDALIITYTFQRRNRRQVPHLCVFLKYFRERALFTRVRVFPNFVSISQYQLAKWIEHKQSTFLPVLIIKTAEFGIVSDRQLSFMLNQKKINVLPGGRLLSILAV